MMPLASNRLIILLNSCNVLKLFEVRVQIHIKIYNCCSKQLFLPSYIYTKGIQFSIYFCLFLFVFLWSAATTSALDTIIIYLAWLETLSAILDTQIYIILCSLDNIVIYKKLVFTKSFTKDIKSHRPINSHHLSHLSK